MTRLADVQPADREQKWRNAHLPPSKQEIEDRLLLKQVHGDVTLSRKKTREKYSTSFLLFYRFVDIVHEQIKRRGVKVWTNLGRHFRYLDANNQKDGRLNKCELEKGLIDFRIEIPQDVRVHVHFLPIPVFDHAILCTGR